MRAKYSYTHFIMYKPYSPEWHRYRYLKEAIDTYFDDYVDNEVIYEDIMNILGSRMSSAVDEVNKVMDLKDKLKIINMLSTAYRLRLESICRCIANKEQVPLEDMIWAEKLAKAHTLARDWLNKARRQASQDIQEGSMDDFMNKMGLGDPDPSNYKTGFDGADEIVDWFKQDKPDDWRQRD